MFIDIFITGTGPLRLPLGDKLFAKPLGRLRIGRRADRVGYLGDVTWLGHCQSKLAKSGFANVVRQKV